MTDENDELIGQSKDEGKGEGVCLLPLISEYWFDTSIQAFFDAADE